MWKCEECGGELIEDTGGFLVCSECGLTYGKVYDVREDPIYDESTNASHYEIREKYNITKKDLRKCSSRDLKRALKWDSFESRSLRKYVDVKTNVKRICSLLNVNSERCFYLLEKISKNDLLSTQGKDDYEIPVAVVYLQLRLEGKPVFLHDFEKLGFSKKNILGYYTNWIEKLKLKVKPQTPKLIVNRIVNFLIKDHLKTFRSKFLLIKDSIQLAEKYYYLGNYIITCGACVYIKSKESNFGITQKEIRELIGCSHQALISYIQKISKLEINL